MVVVDTVPFGPEVLAQSNFKVHEVFDGPINWVCTTTVNAQIQELYFLRQEEI